jgi:hypothetical protein
MARLEVLEMVSEQSNLAFHSLINSPSIERGDLPILPNAVLIECGVLIWKRVSSIISPEPAKPATAGIMGLVVKQDYIFPWMWPVIPRIISMSVILGVIGFEESMVKQE